MSFHAILLYKFFDYTDVVAKQTTAELQSYELTGQNKGAHNHS